MKKIIAATFILATSTVYAESVKGVGMQGYFVYQDSNGNKYVTHPTVPGVAYDLNGKKLEAVPGGIKYATVQSDGTIMPFNENGSGLFNTISWIVLLAIVGVAVWGFMKNKNRIVMKRQELEVMARLKENISNDAGNLFTKFHKNFRPSQIDYFEQNASGALLSSIRDSIMSKSDFKDVTVNSLKFDVDSVYREQEKTLASVRFNCVRNETEDGKTFSLQSNEKWKFQLIDNKWVVCEIKELAPTIKNEVKAVVEVAESVVEKEMQFGDDKFRL